MSKQEQSSNTTHSEKNILTSNIVKLVFSFSLPIIILQLTSAFYVIIDRSMAAHLTAMEGGAYYGVDGISVDAAAAISIAAPLIGLFVSFTILFSVGGSINYALFIGQKKYDKAKAYLGSSLMMNLILSFAMVLASLTLGNLFIKHFFDGMSDSTKQAAIVYLSIFSLSYPISATFDYLLRIVRLEGKSTSSSLIALTAIPLNIIFAYFLMAPNYGGYGVGASAFATVLASAFTLFFLFMMIVKMKRNKTTNMFESRHYNKITKEMTRESALLGMPTIVRRIVQSFTSFLIIVYVIILSKDSGLSNDMGLDTSASNISQSNELSTEALINVAGSVNSVQAIVTLTMMGLMQGTSSIMAVNYAAKNIDRCKELTKVVIILGITLSFITVLIFEIFANGTLEILSNTWNYYLLNPLVVNPDLFVESSIHIFRILTLSTIFMAFSFIPYWFFNFSGQKAASIWTVILRGLIIYPFMVMPLALIMTKYGSWELGLWAVNIAEIIFLIYSVTYFAICYKHFGKAGFKTYEARYLEWKNRKNVFSIGEAKMEEYYLLTYGDSYISKFKDHMKIINAVKNGEPLLNDVEPITEDPIKKGNTQTKPKTPKTKSSNTKNE